MKKITLLILAAALSVGTVGDRALAQNYPDKKIRIVVGFPPGGASDIVARLVAPGLSKELNTTVYVENKPGASATIAARIVAKESQTDGYTVLLSSVTDTAQPALRDDLSYDYERDLTHVSLLGEGPMVLLVNPNVPVHNVKELIALAKAEPGKLDYGSAGIGSANHLSGELFNMMTGLKIVHVPFKGAADSITATLAGNIPMTYAVFSGALPLMQAGQLRPIAVTSLERFSLAPSIPTFNESGLPGYNLTSWWGLSVRAGTPKEIVDKLNAAIVRVVQMPETKKAFNQVGIEPRATTPDEYATFIRGRLAEDAKLLKATGASPEADAKAK
ncbi:MAG: tripartite tricarboxylate transporter substrate binding protein [Pseudolabrys sp.]